ncbi:Lrp/AsnC family transcriptional regulator [Croceivirga sp. JEA036]|uniref:Lrp/AsnC family transcriptional regulator n=1 Tax=Croceivirga sp. JEA036 TaxID=2721162 RepID=UPI00143C4209|nr:Lrp/AsnC family transcriptional regulator [Croceivirga sp. JEA036]NJB37821.1 Lrp/AsnC family transcriptional regulator [Croceivirga sp. JEA036]
MKNTNDFSADSIDLAILQALQTDSRQSFAAIGRTISLSASAVRERVLKMEDTGLIKKYSVTVDYSLLGYDLEAIILVKVFHGKLKPFLAFLPQLKAVQKAHRITGNQNVHLHVLLKNQLQLQQLIDSLMDYGDTHTLLVLSEIETN